VSGTIGSVITIHTKSSKTEEIAFAIKTAQRFDTCPYSPLRRQSVARDLLHLFAKTIQLAAVTDAQQRPGLSTRSRPEALRQ
jgi:hypothetical protein